LTKKSNEKGREDYFEPILDINMPFLPFLPPPHPLICFFYFIIDNMLHSEVETNIGETFTSLYPSKFALWAFRCNLLPSFPEQQREEVDYFIKLITTNLFI
jgi:hypothetical protein